MDFCNGPREANIESGINSDELILFPSPHTFIRTLGLDTPDTLDVDVIRPRMFRNVLKGLVL